MEHENPTSEDDATQRDKRVLAAQDGQHYVLKLYVTGHTPRSIEAVAAIRSICEEHLAGRYELQVIDVYQQLQLAEGEQIIAAPTLIKLLPLPLRRMVGNMSNEEKVLLGLDLRRIT